MSYISSQVLEAAFSGASCSGIAASAPSSASPTHKPSSSLDSKTARSRRSPSFPTYAPLTADRGAALLTWWLAGFRARTSALPEVERASTASDLGSGGKWRESWARYDRDTSSWKTAQLSLLGDSEPSSVIWPRSGSMRSGECYPLLTSAPHICGSASGYSRETWPTPIRNDAEKRGNFDPLRSWGLAAAVRLWQTPVADDAVDRAAGKWNSRGEPKLSAQVLIELEANQSGASGRLNPEFVEWLMGWPIGHTGLEPVATDRLREWRQQHSPCSPPNLIEEAD